MTSLFFKIPISLIILLSIVACQNQPIIKESIDSQQLEHILKIDKRITHMITIREKQILHQSPTLFPLIKEKLELWIENINDIEFKNNPSSNFSMLKRTPQQLIFKTKQGSWQLSGYYLDDKWSYLRVSIKMNDPKKSSQKVGYLSSTHLKEIFIDLNDLRKSSFSLKDSFNNNIEGIAYNNKTEINLANKQIKGIKNLLTDLKVKSYPFDGIPSADQLRKFGLGVPTDANVPGHLTIATSQIKKNLHFGRPFEDKAILRLYLDGEMQIYDLEFSAWLKLTKLLKN